MTTERDKSHMGREIAAQRDMLLAALQNLHREVNLAAGSNPRVAAALKTARRAMAVIEASIAKATQS